MAEAKGPLHGIRVIDLGRHQAGPRCADRVANQLLTDLKLAPRDTSGQVHVAADVCLLRSVQADRGNHRLFFSRETHEALPYPTRLSLS